MYRTLNLPGGYWISIRTWYRKFDAGPRWTTGYGLHESREISMPLLGKQVTVHGPGKRNRELVGLNVKNAENYLDWILEEFDSSFNELAIASMQYHMDHSVAACHPKQRAIYQDIIDRLSEKRPRICATEQQRETYDAWHADDLTRESITEWLNKPTPPEIQEIHDDYERRTDEYHDRINKARHDFVDIMPHLWS